MLNLIIGELLSMFGILWICKSTFSTLNFIVSKFKEVILGENLATKLRCAVSMGYTLGFQIYLIWKG